MKHLATKIPEEPIQIELENLKVKSKRKFLSVPMSEHFRRLLRICLVYCERIQH
jgi:hypothetical protein